jgi:glutamate-1-semialdehyde 2,1-aminomutase
MKIIDEYFRNNQGSLQAYEKAKSLLPSGNTRSSIYWKPFPLCMRKGEKSHIWDVDGNKRIDFNYNNTTLILGHNHPKVIKAAKDQLIKGTMLGAPTESEPKLAEEILGRLKGAEKIRFTPSGTEANMQALRTARAFTGKSLIAKCFGGYHGSWDAVPITSDSKGIPQTVKNSTLYFPYNNPEAATYLIRKYKDELAAVVVEPTMRDMTPRPGFLEALRESTERHDVLLVFDEVISFRISYGGAQEFYGVSPDITTMGKIIGGGFPVGAYASTDEFMSPLLIPEAELPETSLPCLGFSGTFNAHPLSMAAGLAVMKEMNKTKYVDLELKGEDIRKNLRTMLNEEGLRLFVGGAGSLFFVSWTNKEVYDYKTAMTADSGLFNIFNLGMMNKGIFILGHPNVSVVQSNKEIQTAVDTARETLREMKPLIQDRAPNLLS